MADSKLKLTNGEGFTFRVPSILVIFPSTHMQVRAKTFQVIMNFL